MTDLSKEPRDPGLPSTSPKKNRLEVFEKVVETSLLYLAILGIFGFWMAGIMVGGETGHHLASCAGVSVAMVFLLGWLLSYGDDD